VSAPGPALLDLDRDSRLALEFDELLAWVASFARTAAGARRVLAAAPLAGLGDVQEELASTAEIARVVAADGAWLAVRLPDADAALARLAVAGLTLEARAVRELALVAAAASELGLRLQGLGAEAHPRLRELGRRLPDLRTESAAVLRAVDPEGRILDAASPELARLRAAAARVGERLRTLLERRLRDPEDAAAIRDDFVTERNGRFVIPLRVDAPRPIRGIVHATSSSGLTRFVEPLEAIEINNERVQLAEQERHEEQRVLAVWSEAFRRRLEEARAVIEGLARFDELQARALFARALDAAPPRVFAAGALRLAGARHPLLQRRLQEQGGACVPLDLELAPPHQVLVISGPNTGGKTVALKTLGLSVLMAQAGLPIPALQADLPLYRQVRVDIGDRQSIAADLSTFSAHVRAMAGFVRTVAPPALFLFDEIGTGTEPTEGAALARAVLESLVGQAVTAVATTHHGALKAWAVTTAGAACAAMEFDELTLRPTYRLRLGSAGVSAGIDIAERLGLDPRIVGRARALLDPDARLSESYLRQLRASLAEVERARVELARREGELAAEQRRVAERAEREAVERGARARAELERVIEEARRLARREIEALGEEAARARGARRWSRAETRLRGELERRRRTIEPAGPVVDRPRPAEPHELTAGVRVLVRSLGREGEIRELRGRRAEVLLGGVVFAVDVGDLSVSASGDRAVVRQQARHEPAFHVETARDRQPPRELLLLGRTVDEALAEVDRYLDAARLAGFEQVRVVHGHGSGRLRAAVRRFLDGHAHVAAHRPGGPGEGGDGATVVTLA
jgi:DNA mismatch repair protein MutS2